VSKAFSDLGSIPSASTISSDLRCDWAIVWSNARAAERRRQRREHRAEAVAHGLGRADGL